MGLWFVQIEGQNHHHIHIRSNKCTQMDPVVIAEKIVVLFEGFAEIGILVEDFAETVFVWVGVLEV